MAHTRAGIRLLSALSLLTVATHAPAQLYGSGTHGTLAPTRDVTLDTTANGGIFHFTVISIPVNVTVHLVGPNPATLLCQGAVTVDGSIEADGKGSDWRSIGGGLSSTTGGPGGYDGGRQYMNGSGPGGGPWGSCIYPASWGGCASHATEGSTSGNPCLSPAPTYGSALPFELEGGSGGGGQGTIGGISSAGPPGSGGGGALAILAGGPIVVSGIVSARGGDILFDSALSMPNGRGGNGSGGSILLRSLQGVTISGTVDATGGETRDSASTLYAAGDGFVRVDGYSAYGAPNLAGATIRPAPLVVSMPYLTDLGPARIGQVYAIRCAAPPGDVLGFYFSFGTGLAPVPPFGVLELDPTRIFMLGQFTVPTTGHDPLAVIDVAIPNIPALVGVTVHSQAFNAFGTVTGRPRLSNRLVTTLRS